VFGRCCVTRPESSHPKAGCQIGEIFRLSPHQRVSKRSKIFMTVAKRCVAARRPSRVPPEEVRSPSGEGRGTGRITRRTHERHIGQRTTLLSSSFHADTAEQRWIAMARLRTPRLENRRGRHSRRLCELPTPSAIHPFVPKAQMWLAWVGPRIPAFTSRKNVFRPGVG